MKKLITMICVCLVLFSSLAFAEDDFTITPETSDGELLKEIGLISGNGTDLGEENQITREELIVMLVKMTVNMDEPFTVPTKATFKDVPTDHWAFEWVERAAHAKITSGLGDGNFGLGQYVSEQQAAAFLMNALEKKFTWDTVVDEAKAVGLDAKKEEEQLLRKHIFTLSRQALDLNKGDSKLINHSGNFDAEKIKVYDEYQGMIDKTTLETKYSEKPKTSDENGPKMIEHDFKDADVDYGELLGVDEESLLEELENKYGDAPRLSFDVGTLKLYYYEDTNFGIAYTIVNGVLKNVIMGGYKAEGEEPNKKITTLTDLSVRSESVFGVTLNMTQEEVEKTVNPISKVKEEEYPGTTKMNYTLENNISLDVTYMKNRIIGFRVYHSDFN